MYNERPRRKSKTVILFIIALMALVLGIYGCQFFGSKEQPVSVNDQMPLERRIGIIKSLGGVKTTNEGTHLLQLDDGTTILLKSLQINMDDPTYLGKTVEVRGILTYTTDNKQIMNVMNIDLVQAETAVAPQVTSWKDYAGDKLGLQLKYRDDMTVDDQSGNSVTFNIPVQSQEESQQTESTAQAPATPHQMTIMRDVLGSSETMLSKLGLKKGDQGELLAAGYSRSKIGSDNYDALKKTDGNVTSYYIGAPGYLYTIKIDCGNDGNTLGDQNLFYEMLGTLKITGVSGTSLTQETAPGTNVAVPTEQTVTPAPEATTETQAVAPAKTGPATQVVIPSPTPLSFQTQESAEAALASSLTQESQEAPAGFTTLQSDSFKFSVQYPKSWYYSGTTSTESNVIRHYEFGSKPLDQTPGNIYLDLMSGSIPGGSTSTVNGKTITAVTSGDTVQLYVKGSGSRVYRISGPSSQESTLLQVAGSVQD